MPNPPRLPIDRNPPPQRVFITGAGMISPMGNDANSHLESLRAGRTHFREVDFFDVSRQRVKTAGVADPPADAFALTPREAARLDRGAKLLLHATAQAISCARLTEIHSGIPFVLGTSAGGMPLGEAYYRGATAAPRGRCGQFTRIEHYQPQRQAGAVQRALDFQARTQIISNACASGANAIGHAFHMIRSGRESMALAGGYDALCQLVFAGFDSLQALAPSGIPRPFDTHRDGLALGEGAAIFLLESEETMVARGATPLAEIRGYGMATDLHHLTQPHPTGSAAVRSMTAACHQAEVFPRDIQYINSHGTGTPLNDVAEASAISEWAGDDAQNVAVSSTKSAMGHLLGGAGAVESAICLIALKHQLLPASLNVSEIDPACHFDLVRKPQPASVDVVLTNSFGFGGSNASLIFRSVN